MEYCCHFWARAPSCYLDSCYLDMLDKLQRQIFGAVAPSVAASLEPLAHRRNVASLSLFYRYFGSYSTELAELVPLSNSRGRFALYSDRFHDFSVVIPRQYKDVYVYSFLPRTARLCNSLAAESFPLTYDLNGCTS